MTLDRSFDERGKIFGLGEFITAVLQQRSGRVRNRLKSWEVNHLWTHHLVPCTRMAQQDSTGLSLSFCKSFHFLSQEGIAHISRLLHDGSNDPNATAVGPFGSDALVEFDNEPIKKSNITLDNQG
jgi:hypothetical protein